MTGIRVFCRTCKAEWDATFEVGCTHPAHDHQPIETAPLAA